MTTERFLYLCEEKRDAHGAWSMVAKEWGEREATRKVGLCCMTCEGGVQ